MPQDEGVATKRCSNHQLRCNEHGVIFLSSIIRRPPDYSSNLCPPNLRHLLYDFLGGALGHLYKKHNWKEAQTHTHRHTPKSHIANVLGGHRLDE